MDYMKCNKDGDCSYSAVNLHNTKYCKNDLTDCANQAYLADQFYADILDARCDISKKRADTNATMLKFVIPIYITLVAIIATMFMYRWIRNSRVQPIPVLIYFLSILMMIPVLFCVFPPFGIVQVSNQRGLYEGGGLPFNGEGGFDFTMVIVPIALGLLLVITFVPYVYSRGKLKVTNKQEVKR
jgi:hypothetical protein